MAHKKKILITGVSGLLGSNVAYCWRDKYEILGLYHNCPVSIVPIKTKTVDILSVAALKNIITEFDPQVVIHCAALTNIDFCEKNPDATHQTNVMGTKNVAESLQGKKTKLVYISTDCVYDGTKKEYRETDPVKPLSQYARSKYEGEMEALKIKNSLIARTSIFGWNIQNKLSLGEWVIHELSAGKEIQGFTDILTAFLYTFTFAGLLNLALEADLNGVYHFASRDILSKYDFAVKIADFFQLDKNLIKPASVDDSKLLAKRSKALMLNTDKLTQALQRPMPAIADSIESFFADFKKGIPERIKGEVFPASLTTIR